MDRIDKQVPNNEHNTGGFQTNGSIPEIACTATITYRLDHILSEGAG